MIASASQLSVNPLFLRHDLMIELGRLEMTMERMRRSEVDTAASSPQLTQLETRRARISEALSRMPA